MLCPTWIRVVFPLFCLASPAVAGVQLTPWAAPIALPETLRGKAVWSLCRLPGDQLAVGFEGGVAIGVPGGAWSIVATPDGSPAQNLVAAHGRVLTAGGGCVGFVEGTRFLPVAGIGSQIDEVQSVPEGWLLLGPAGLWLVDPGGQARRLAGVDLENATPSLGRWHDQILLLRAPRPPLAWEAGQLVNWSERPPSIPPEPRLLRDNVWFSNAGVFDNAGSPILPGAAATTLLDEAGLIGIVAGSPWTVCATYWKGVLAYPTGEATPALTWPDLGSCYTFNQDSGTFLLGTTTGAFSLADSNRVRTASFPNAEILHLETTAGGARLVTLHGVIDIGTAPDTPAGHLWPAADGASVVAGSLLFRDQSFELPTRYVNGLSVCEDSAAVAYGNIVLITRHGAPAVVELRGGATSLATDGRAFFVGTHADGAHAISPAGELIEHFGSGRTKVRALAPGKLALLFWGGDIRDGHGGLLGHVPTGNPRDATLVDIRRPDGSTAPRQLAVLTTRADGAPVVGWLEQERWRPLALPELSAIDAEAIAADTENLYVAGRHGILAIRLPLEVASAPIPRWRWTDGSATSDRALSTDRTEQVTLIPGKWQVPTEAKIGYTIRTADGAEFPAAAGVALQIPVDWGSNHLTLEAERNGLVSRRTLTVIRPYPWALRPWAIALEAVLLAAAVWGLARWRTHHLVRRTRELEQAVAQRTTQLRKANTAKEEFLASVSHEIRNPLNGVVGICAILQDSELGPRERQFVGVLAGCAQQLHSMLDDVLDFSRIDRGDITLNTVAFEVCSLVEESVRVMDPLLESCSLQGPETPQWLSGDAGKIRQIICNLVSNALKYGRPREAGIDLRLTPVVPGRTRLRLAVHNTGPTIPAAELPLLFESFRRGRDTGNTPGFGLGLAVCRRLAERMGGALTAASADGATEFTLELELPVTTPPRAHESAPVVVSRALAIEDEDYNRLALGHALRALGYEIDWATDGATALQLARQQTYDLILTDWKLPDIDGDELCRQLHTVLTPPRPPIVAVTAYSSTEKLAAARAAGMAGFVTKPVTGAKLEEAIRNLDTGPRPSRISDAAGHRDLPEALHLLGDLAPTLEKIAGELGSGWRQAEAQCRLRDPRAGRSAHALRSVLLLAGEADLAEQLGLLETAASAADWPTAERLLPFLAEEIAAARARLIGQR